MIVVSVHVNVISGTIIGSTARTSALYHFPVFVFIILKKAYTIGRCLDRGYNHLHLAHQAVLSWLVVVHEGSMLIPDLFHIRARLVIFFTCIKENEFILIGWVGSQLANTSVLIVKNISKS